MEQRQVFLERNRSVKSVNTESFTNVGLSAKTRLLPYNDIADTISLYQVYNDERDVCERFRLIFTINPICTNVLFNARTEAVRYEGSDDCVLLTGITKISADEMPYVVNKTPLDWEQAIRDTEYSQPELMADNEPLIYHCGWDIFNNHMLRKDDFVYVSKTKETDNNNFNTLKDYVRDNNGSIVSDHIVSDTGETINTAATVDRHIYQIDTTRTFYGAFANGLAVENGWYGFTNPNNIEIPNVKAGEKWVSVNRLMNNNKACEFIDLYPDRSLFSFIPKVNRYRKRLERNWDYCITYPYMKDKDMLATVMGQKEGLTEEGGKCALKIVESEVTFTDSGIEMLRFKTIFKHTLKVGDNVTIFYGNNMTKYPTTIKVSAVGKDDGAESDRYFSIKRPSVDFGNKVYYRKNVDGYDCQYYFRKFKKITIDGKELDSEINKLAYGETIYGDRVAQIVFTDTIDLSGLVDENGRPVSELYLTIVKANRGHDEWYGGNVNSASVEYSHCFGKVTAGLDMPNSDSCRDYNVRRLHNINWDDLTGNKYGELNREIWENTSVEYPAAPLQDNIKATDDEFWGDIVEFVPSKAQSVVIEPVYFRFNTAQREDTTLKFADILYDRLDGDDYDINVNTSVNGFTVTSGYINMKNLNKINDPSQPKFNGNINPEGYYYMAHNKIKIREESSDVNTMPVKRLSYTSMSMSTNVSIGVDENGNDYTVDKVSFIIPVYKTYIKEDTMCLYDKEEKTTVWGYVETSEKLENVGTKVTCIVPKGSVNHTKFIDRGYAIVYSENAIPSYATYLPNSNKFVWRSIVAPSELPQTSDIYDMPFANGCFYKETNVNFFLRRQDPRNEYYMLAPEDEKNGINPLTSYRMWGYDNIDTSGIRYAIAGINSICY